MAGKTPVALKAVRYALLAGCIAAFIGLVYMFFFHVVFGPAVPELAQEEQPAADQ